MSIIRGGETDTRGRDGYVKTEAQTEVMHLQTKDAKDCKQMTEARRSQEKFSCVSFRGTMILPTI